MSTAELIEGRYVCFPIRRIKASIEGRYLLGSVPNVLKSFLHSLTPSNSVTFLTQGQNKWILEKGADVLLAFEENRQLQYFYTE